MAWPDAHRCQFLSSDRDRQAFLDYATKVVLYQPLALLHQAAALPQGARVTTSRSAQPQSAARVSPTSTWQTCSMSVYASSWRVSSSVTPHAGMQAQAFCGCLAQANGSMPAPASGQGVLAAGPEAVPPVPPGLCPADVKEIEGKRAPEGAASAARVRSLSCTLQILWL